MARKTIKMYILVIIWCRDCWWTEITLSFSSLFPFWETFVLSYSTHNHQIFTFTFINNTFLPSVSLSLSFSVHYSFSTGFSLSICIISGIATKRECTCYTVVKDEDVLMKTENFSQRAMEIREERNQNEWEKWTTNWLWSRQDQVDSRRVQRIMLQENHSFSDVFSLKVLTQTKRRERERGSEWKWRRENINRRHTRLLPMNNFRRGEILVILISLNGSSGFTSFFLSFVIVFFTQIMMLMTLLKITWWCEKENEERASFEGNTHSKMSAEFETWKDSILTVFSIREFL